MTLTISDNVAVKFLSGASMRVDGRVVAPGDSGPSAVTFTSIDDNSAGGTTGSGNPMVGDWLGIAVYPGGSVALTHTDLFFSTRAISATRAAVQLAGGRVGHAAAEGVAGFDADVALIDEEVGWTGGVGVAAFNSTLPPSATRLTVTNSLIHDTAHHGIFVQRSAARSVSTTVETVVEGAAGNGQGHGLRLAAAQAIAPVIANNAIVSNTLFGLYVTYLGGGGVPDLGAANSNTFQGNGVDNAIGLGGTLGRDTTLPPAYPLPLVVTNEQLEIAAGATLTVAAGVTSWATRRPA